MKGDKCKSQDEKVRRCHIVDTTAMAEVESLLSGHQVVQSTFMDIDEDGRLDILF